MGPIVVHCTAGVGRSACIIMVDVILRSLFSGVVVQASCSLFVFIKCFRPGAWNRSRKKRFSGSISWLQSVFYPSQTCLRRVKHWLLHRRATQVTVQAKCAFRASATFCRSRIHSASQKSTILHSLFSLLLTVHNVWSAPNIAQCCCLLMLARLPGYKLLKAFLYRG